MAKNIIDALVVTLGLDPKGFTKGQREAVEALNKTKKTATETDKSIRTGHAKTTRAMRDTGQVAERVARGLKANGQQGAEFFDQMARSGLKLLAILTAGKALGDFARDTITTAAAQGRLAGNLGVSTRALTQWGAAVKQFAGGNAGTAEASMGSLLQSYQKFRYTGTPSESMMIMSRYLGLPISDLRSKNFSTLIGDLAAKFHAMPKQRAYAVGHSMGFDDGTINLLEQGRAAVRRHLRAVATEGTVTGKQAEAMQKLQTAMISVETASTTLGRTLLTDVAPALTGFANHLARLFELMAGKPLTPQEKKLKGAMRPKGWANTPEGHWLQHFFEGKSAPLTSAQRGTRNEIIRYLMGKGLTRAQAAGVAANALGESSLSPHPKGNPTHYGLWQWDETRRKQILAGTGIDVKTAGTKRQLKALWWELNHTHEPSLHALQNSPNAGSAAIAFDNLYERNHNTPHQKLMRGRWATHMFNATATSLPPSVTSVLAGLRASQVHHHHTTTNHAETHISQISVNTQAKDANGIAGAIGHSIRRHGLATQANGGLS